MKPTKIYFGALLLLVLFIGLPSCSSQEKPDKEAESGNKPVAGDNNKPEAGTRNEQQHIDDSFDPYNEGEADSEEIPLDKFDFDPSEGLSFIVDGRSKECFYEEAKTTTDRLSGAYLISAADPSMDVEIKGPTGALLFSEYDMAEEEYDIDTKDLGTYEICFHNRQSEPKSVTHVTATLQSQHPVKKEHVSLLFKLASHLDIKLGELESEQRLMELRTKRHLKTEESTNQRVSLYGVVETVVYLTVSIVQVIQIKRMLDTPRHLKSWA